MTQVKESIIGRSRKKKRLSRSFMLFLINVKYFGYIPN